MITNKLPFDFFYKLKKYILTIREYSKKWLSLYKEACISHLLKFNGGNNELVIIHVVGDHGFGRMDTPGVTSGFVRFVFSSCINDVDLFY